jgi:putative endonuclease
MTIMKQSWVYILKCSDGSYYAGCTTNLEQRIQEHNFKKYDNYTSTRLLVELVYSQQFANINDAIAAERQIKGWNRRKKEALINGDFDLLHNLAECKNETTYKNRKG